MWSLFGRGKNDADKHQAAEAASENERELAAENPTGQVTAGYPRADVAEQYDAATAQSEAETIAVPEEALAAAQDEQRRTAAPYSAEGSAAVMAGHGAGASGPEAARETAPGTGREAAQEPQKIAPDFSEIHAKWREATKKLGGYNPLLHFDDAAQNRIDFAATNPGGLAQFITGQKILLSALVRDEVALRKAKFAAGRITDKATEMRNMRGLETVHLGIGLAKWRFEGDDFCAPVLLRPLAIRRYGRDFEIKLKGGVSVNPELVRVLRLQYGIAVDARGLVELSQVEGVFKPQPVIERLRQMAAGIPEFSVEPRLVASSFNSIAARMLGDLVDLDTPLLRAICGDSDDRAAIRTSYHPTTPTPLDQRSPETDTYLYDADVEQDDVITQIRNGYSLAVHTLPGTGGTQTVVNAIGELVRDGKKVLVVSPRTATLDGISHRLNRAGLTGLVTTPRKLRRNLVDAISRNEQAQPVNNREIDQALTRLRSVLVDYREALDAKDAKLGISPLEALRELAKLSLLQEPPRTTVRLSETALHTLAMDRSSVTELLTEVARLGQFQYGPEDSPWYGVTFSTTEEARGAYTSAVEISETRLPRLTALAHELLQQTALKPYENLYELGIYLRLLTGIGETLDRFTPEVYDRSLTEVIAAHAPRSTGDTMTNANRRRLKKLAREYVRPGVTITDMYPRLVEIQQQRVLWQRYCTVPGTRPELPLGLAEVVAAFQSVYDELETLDQVLGTEQEAARMRNLPLAQLSKRVAALAEESEVLQNIQERTAIIERLRDADLGALFDDLSKRHVLADNVAAELEQAWWQTALERILAENPALLGANSAVIERLESDFRLVDDAHTSSNGQVLAAQLADLWRVALIDNRAEATELRGLLRSGGVDPASLVTAAPNLTRSLAHVWAVSPYEVSLLPQELKFDAVILVDAAAVSLVEALGALRRGGQVVAFGDPVVQTPADFNIGVSDADYITPDVPLNGAETTAPLSVFAALTKVLPQLTLTRSYRAGGADLTDLVNSKFYSGAIETMPWAGTFLGRSSLTQEFVRAGQGLPDQQTGAVESTDAEVERVVQLVLEHASERPNESLMVITASKKHAVRVWQSTLSYFAKFPQYRNFLLGDHAEPFTVVTLEQATALSRDRVIFSIGYGRTPHGRVLSNFGPLSQPGGDRLIAVAMTRARRAMTIVSCFEAEHLAEVKARYGVKQLAAVIGAEAKPVPESQLPAEQDPMIAELAQRLEGLGLQVALNYQGVIPIAAALGERAIAIDIDFSGDEESMRHILRLRPAVLRRLGWHYQRIQSFDLFQNPAEVAVRVASIIGYDPAAAAVEKTANITEQGLQLSDDEHNMTQVIEPLPTASQSVADGGVVQPVMLNPGELEVSATVSADEPAAAEAQDFAAEPEAEPAMLEVTDAPEGSSFDNGNVILVVDPETPQESSKAVVLARETQLELELPEAETEALAEPTETAAGAATAADGAEAETDTEQSAAASEDAAGDDDATAAR